MTLHLLPDLARTRMPDLDDAQLARIARQFERFARRRSLSPKVRPQPEAAPALASAE